MFLKTTTAIMATILSVSTMALASETDSFPQPSNAIEAQGQQNARQLMSQLQSVENQALLAQYTQFGLNQIVKEGAEQLQAMGKPELAEQLLGDWAENYSMALLMDGVLDLGDHKPLNEKLGYICKAIEQQVGVQKMKETRLYDLIVVNFGIPVVVRPNGNAMTNEAWDKAEYQKHFVPLFGTITYWGSYGVCLYAASQGHQSIKPYCKKISTVAERLSSIFSPQLSDTVYDKSHSSN